MSSGSGSGSGSSSGFVEGESSVFAYTPSKVAPIIFCVLFAISTAVHLAQNLKYKTWLLTGALPWAGLLFVGGFATREVAAYHDTSLGAYIASIVLLFVAPPVYAAANYIILGRTMYYLPYLAPMHPGRVVTTFIGLDTLVAILTGAGAGRISNYSDPTQVRVGTALIKASLLLQLALFSCFISLEVLFHYRAAKANLLTRNVRMIIIILYASSFCILVRNVYRTVETFEGPLGNAQRHEVYLYVFEGSFMLAASILLNSLHPARFLPKSNKIYLSQDGQREVEGPGWEDRRNFFVTLVDPFDLGGLIKGKDKEHGKFWEHESQDAGGASAAETHPENMEMAQGGAHW